MTIIIYRRNDDTTFVDACRAEADVKYPDATIKEGNPKYFKADAFDKADLVYVNSRYTVIRNTYVAAGAAVITAPAVPSPPEPEEPFTDDHEQEALELLALAVKELEQAVENYSHEALRIARDREKKGRKRVTAIRAYDEALGE